jgi:hypothetical protein
VRIESDIARTSSRITSSDVPETARTSRRSLDRR